MIAVLAVAQPATQPTASATNWNAYWLRGDLNLRAKSLILGGTKKAGSWPAFVCL